MSDKFSDISIRVDPTMPKDEIRFEKPPRPCGCPGDDVCLHGIPAIIGTCEDFPITWRNEYLGIPRDGKP